MKEGGGVVGKKYMGIGGSRFHDDHEKASLSRNARLVFTFVSYIRQPHNDFHVKLFG